MTATRVGRSAAVRAVVAVVATVGAVVLSMTALSTPGSGAASAAVPQMHRTVHKATRSAPAHPHHAQPAGSHAPSLSVSSTRVPVPDVTGKAVADADAELEVAGLKAIHTPVNVVSPADVAVRTTPAAGTEVEAGTTVAVLVSTGYVVLPDLAGMTVADAQAALQDLGCDLKSPSPDGHVSSQQPGVGTQFSYDALEAHQCAVEIALSP